MNISLTIGNLVDKLRLSVYTLVVVMYFDTGERKWKMRTEEKNVRPIYAQIAEDIARRIIEGGMLEGARIYGRSMLSSEYGVSPETIRRALRLLADMKVIEVKPQSGATVLSLDSAKRYIDRMEQLEESRGLQSKLTQLLNQQERLTRELSEVSAAIAKRQEMLFSAVDQGFCAGEVRIGAKAWVIGKSIGQLAFWQATGATIIAIRRGQGVIVSPGPYAELYENDEIVFVGNQAAMDMMEGFVNATNKQHEGRNTKE